MKLMKDMTTAWLVKISNSDDAIFIYNGGQGYLVRRKFGDLRVKENRHTAPHPGWESIPLDLSNPAVIAALAAIDREKSRAMDAQIAEGIMLTQQEYAKTYPYFVKYGRYNIPRVWRIEQDKGGRKLGRIYDRKNDKWGKTLRPLRTILAVMDETQYQIWRDTGKSVYLISTSVSELANPIEKVTHL
jgi:hypothetical protein